MDHWIFLFFLRLFFIYSELAKSQHVFALLMAWAQGEYCVFLMLLLKRVCVAWGLRLLYVGCFGESWELSVTACRLSEPEKSSPYFSAPHSLSLSLTAHSQYGKDNKVKLPNLTDEEVNWQGLEDLYSINESLYECRPDYSPSPENWDNFQKDVDKMFALRHVFNNQTHKLDDSTLPELGSGAGGGGLEVGSGEELASASDVWPGLVTETRLTTPIPSKIPSARPTPRPTLEQKLEPAVNDLPERLVSGPETSVMSKSAVISSPGLSRGRDVLHSDTWAQLLEEIEGETFSGNGLTELETRHDDLLRTHNSLRAQLELGPGHRKTISPQGLSHNLDPEEEDDIFHAQGFLPFVSQTLRPKVQAGTTGSPPTTTIPTTQTSTQSVRVVLPQSALPITLDYEASGSLPQPSSQTLWGRLTLWPASQ